MEELANNLSAGYVLDHYTIREVLGAGSFGITYKAYDNQLQQWVAIKEFLPSDMAGRGVDGITVQPRKDSSSQFRYGLDRFLEEARTLARFRHPNIVRVSRFLEANGTAYLVMDYVDGQSLSVYLENHPNPVSETLLKAWFVPLLQGLVTVHDAGFLHRDIKPGNIYLRDYNGEPVLIDFGAARQAIGEQSKSVTGIVSAGYAPSEQYGTDAKKQGPWTDLYAVGATLYRCISGTPPTDAPTRQSALMDGDADPLVAASEKGLGQYSAALLQLIDELMVLPIRDRPQSAAPVLAALMSGESAFEVKAHSTAHIAVAERSGPVEPATVFVSDRPALFASQNSMPSQPMPAIDVDGPPKKRVNRKALGVLGALLVLALLVTILVLVQRNSSEVSNRDVADTAEQRRLVMDASKKAKAAAMAEAQKRADAELASCAKTPTCMVDEGGGVLLNQATGLEWTQSDNGGDIGWNEAKVWCESKGDGWRLASTLELASIYDSTETIAPVRCGQAKCFVSPRFQLSSPFFWRSEVTRSTGGAEVVGFFAFNEDLESQPDAAELADNEGLRALCVRRP